MSLKKGRGAQHNTHNRFLNQQHEWLDEFLNHCHIEGEENESDKTKYIEVHPKTIVNKVDSPDVRMIYSMNPYQGCEHGCIYCYARNTHEYWGFSAGLDFERRILVKKNAAKLLEQQLLKKSWKVHPIVLSGNTDCYQPAERHFELTRQCLEVFLKYRHPVGIITKNALILRDLDLIRELAALRLIVVNVSVTSLSEETRRILEPRTASIKRRLETIRELSSNGVPVNAMLAPIIPSINSHEILPLAKAVTDNGALSIAHTIVRLNGAIGEVFSEWIRRSMPDRAEKVLNQIAECHGGQLNDSRYGARMSGEGNIAAQIHDLVRLARKKYLKGKEIPPLDCTLFAPHGGIQGTLF